MQVGLAVDHGDHQAEEVADHHAGKKEEEGGFRGGGGWGAGALRGARVPAPDWPTGRTGSAGCTKAPSLQSAPKQQGPRHQGNKAPRDQEIKATRQQGNKATRQQGTKDQVVRAVRTKTPRHDCCKVHQGRELFS